MRLTIKPDPRPEQGSYYRSDHFSLAQVGIPSFTVGGGTDFAGKPPGFSEQLFKEFNAKHYHQPSDEFHADWDFSGLAQKAQFGLLLGLEAANQDALPTWNAGRRIPAREAKAVRRAAWLLAGPGAGLRASSGIWRRRPDGSRLFFISALRQHGDGAGVCSRRFSRWTRRGFRWSYQPPVPGPEPYSQYSVGPLQAAGDGTWLVYGTQRNCTGRQFVFSERAARRDAGGDGGDGGGAGRQCAAQPRRAVARQLQFAGRDGFVRLAVRTAGRASEVDLTSRGRGRARRPRWPLSGAVLIPAFDRLVLWNGGQARDARGRASPPRRWTMRRRP